MKMGGTNGDTLSRKVSGSRGSSGLNVLFNYFLFFKLNFTQWVARFCSRTATGKLITLTLKLPPTLVPVIYMYGVSTRTFSSDKLKQGFPKYDFLYNIVILSIILDNGILGSTTSPP